MALDYAQVQEGDALPARTRTPVTLRVLQFLGACWLWGPQFHDPDRAARMGLPGPIVPGNMKYAYIHQYLRRWLDDAGEVRRIQLAHRRPDVQNAEMAIGGTVTRKYEQDGRPFADLEIWIDNAQGERSVRGSATVVFD